MSGKRLCQCKLDKLDKLREGGTLTEAGTADTNLQTSSQVQVSGQESGKRLCQCKVDKLNKLREGGTSTEVGTADTNAQTSRVQVNSAEVSGQESGKRFCQCKVNKLRDGGTSTEIRTAETNVQANSQVIGQESVKRSCQCKIEKLEKLNRLREGSTSTEIRTTDINVQESSHFNTQVSGQESGKRICQCRLDKLNRLREGGTSTEFSTRDTNAQTNSRGTVQIGSQVSGQITGQISGQVIGQGSGKSNEEGFDNSDQEEYAKGVLHRKCPVIGKVRDQMAAFGIDGGIFSNQSEPKKPKRKLMITIEIITEPEIENYVPSIKGRSDQKAMPLSLESSDGRRNEEYKEPGSGGSGKSLKDRLWSKRYHIMSLFLLLLLLWLTFAYGLLLGVNLCNASRGKSGQCAGCGVGRIMPGYTSRTPPRLNIY